MSLDKELLRQRLDNFIIQNYPDNRKKECLRWLCEMVVPHHPEDDCEKVGNLSLWKLLPPSKSLFYVGKDKGLAIGNLTSQMLANFYLTPFDYKARELGLDIVRYADDFVVGHHDLEYLKTCIPILKEFAKTHLKLTIHPDKLYMQECSKGVTFVGAIIKQDRIYCGHRAIGKMYDKVASKFPYYEEAELESFVSSVNSYLGLMRHYKSYKVRKKFILTEIDEWLPWHTQLTCLSPMLSTRSIHSTIAQQDVLAQRLTQPVAILSRLSVSVKMISLLSMPRRWSSVYQIVRQPCLRCGKSN